MTPKTYSGTYDGQQIGSLYPNVYRVRFRAYIGGRLLDVDKIQTAGHEYDLRARIMRGYDVRRDGDRFIEIEHVATLDAA